MISRIINDETPLVKFLKTNGTSFYIENIISEASKLLIIITPYLKLTKNLYSRLKETDRRGVTIILVYGKTELSQEQKKYLYELNNLNLYFLKDLHAKCYINERHMLLSSMNLHEYSERNNWEMGILIERDDEYVICDDILREIETILDASKPEKINREDFQLFSKDDYEVYSEHLNFVLETNKFHMQKNIFGGKSDPLGRYHYYILAENFPVEGITYDLTYMLSITLTFNPNKIAKINELFKYDDLLDKCRIYINRPEVISVYKSVELTKKWEDINLTDRKEYWGEIIKKVTERLMSAFNEIKNGN